MKQYAYCSECGDKTIHVKTENSLKDSWKCAECGYYDSVHTLSIPFLMPAYA